MKYAIAVSAACVLVLGGRAAAFINPFFTPVHLVEQSETIVLVEFGQVGQDGRTPATVVEVLKGTPDRTSLTFEFLAGPFEAKAQAVMAQIASGQKRALIFMGAFEYDALEQGVMGAEPGALLHVGRDWVTLTWYAEGETWDMDDVDATLMGTWAGSDVMLQRAVRYLLADEQADVPIISNASWDEKIPAGRLSGKVHGVHPIDLLDDGTIWLHVAAAEGDRLLRWDAGAKQLIDLASRHGLNTRSQAAAWADFNRNGRLDVATYDGNTLSIYYQRADGTFAPAPSATGLELNGGCRSLSVIDLGAKGVGLVIGGRDQPLVATIDERGRIAAATPDGSPVPTEAATLGLAAGRCLVADFGNNSWPDILAVGANGSLLYRGTSEGAFAAPLVVAVGQGAGTAVAFLGDYDMDGLPDVAIVGDQGNRLYHNLGDGAFNEMLAMSGEIEYLAKRGGIGGMTGDVNNNGRQDILILYGARSPQLFFNRGFHSFGHARMLDLEHNKLLEAAQEGQQAGCLADVNGNGALDMVLVLNNGEIWLFPRKVDPIGESGSMALVARVPLKARRAGPITVTGRIEHRCLGAHVLTAGGPPALFGVAEPMPVTVTWQWPGGKRQERELFVAEEPVMVDVTVE